MKSRAAFDMTCLRTSKGWNRLDAIRKVYAHDPALSDMVINTARDVKEFLERAEKLRHLNQPWHDYLSCKVVRLSMQAAETLKEAQ